MQMWQCMPYILLMYMSLSTMSWILKGPSWKHRNVFSVLSCYIFHCQQYGTYSVLHRMYPIFNDYNQIWIFSIEVHKDPQYQISWKYVQGSYADASEQMDWQTWCFQWLMQKGPTNIATDLYRGAVKSLARPGRKQATVTEDFDVHISYL
jgi:hypothetical protein